MMFPKSSKRSKAKAKRAARFREYGKLRVEFLRLNPWCERCGGRASQVHHKAGRQGFLLRVDTWCALCPECHSHVHAHPEESYKRGWLLKRNAESVG